MKIKQTKSCFLAICLVCGLLGCKEEIILPDLEGSLVGFVYTFDEFANVFEDHSGVLITAYGRANISQTHTDARGRFEFRHLPSGTYELHIEKPGFGTMKQFGVQHLGGEATILGLRFSPSTNSSAYFIYQLPTTKILDLSFENDTLSGNFVFKGEEPDILYLLVYLSDVPDFTGDETKEVIKLGLTKFNGNYQGPMYSKYLHFQAGETVYYRAAAMAWNGSTIVDFNRYINGIDNYFDFESNQTIYPNTGDESSQFSFIFPE
jgi:hypothetical protein